MSLPQPYYRDDLATIYNFDCIQGMAELPEAGMVDLLTTSPPYNVGEEYEEGMPFGDYLKLLADMYHVARKAVKRGGYAIVNIDPYYYTGYSGDDQRCVPMEYVHHVMAEHDGWIHECTRVWQKDFATLSDRYSINTLLPKGEAEIIMVYRNPGGSKRKPQEQDRHSHQIWSTAGIKQDIATRKVHQAAYPEAIVHMVFDVYAKKGDIVIDPFMGTGTTLMVAKKRSMSAIGFELRKDYCDIAAVRCSQQTFDVEGVPAQVSIFDAVGLPSDPPPPDDF